MVAHVFFAITTLEGLEVLEVLEVLECSKRDPVIFYF